MSCRAVRRSRTGRRERERLTRLPRGFDPRSVELAQRWKREGLSDAQIVGTALRMIREQNFVYTLRPPTLYS